MQPSTPVSPAGDILSRLSADTTQVSDLISQNINIFLRNVIKGAGDFFFMCVMSWKLTLVTVAGFPFIAFVSKVYGDYYKVSRAAPPLGRRSTFASHPFSTETDQGRADDSGRGQQSCGRDHFFHEDRAQLC